MTPRKKNSSSFGKSQARDQRLSTSSGDVVVAHELTHALQDQHYDLVKLLESSDNWDVTQALHTLIEGDATVVMTLIDKAGPLLALNYRIAPSSVAGLRPLLKLAEAQGGEAAKEAKLLRTTPAVLLDPMLFDYHEGYRFVRKLVKKTDDGEWDFGRVDAAFRSPPLSTEQILHPKKYRGDEPDWPTQLELPDLCETLGPTYMRAGGNTLGEMLIRTLLGRYKVRGRRRKHRGWDGDRIEIYRSKNDGAALLWMSVWDSAKDAREFGEGLRSIQTSRWPDLEFRSKGKQEIWAQDDNKVFGHYRQDDIVIAFQNWPQERLQASLKRLLSETQRIERKPLLPPR